MITERDQFSLRRALRLAMNGRGLVEPNPMVGCVLVKNDTIIGEGWHLGFGQPHAEPTALADCKSRGNDPAGATAYVTLEPCCHTNKKTPPCAPRLIEAKITRVVIGCLDPNPDVNGKGVAMLRAAGIEVEALPHPGPLGEGRGEGLTTSPSNSSSVVASHHHALTPTLSQGERELDASHFKQLIAPFAGKYNDVVCQNLYLTLKWAETADGFVAGENGARLQISNHSSSKLVQHLRARSAAIIVGVNTVITDDPLLTVRNLDLSGFSRVINSWDPSNAKPFLTIGDVHIGNPPTRVVLDRNLRIPSTAKLLKTSSDAQGNVLIFCSPETCASSPRVAELRRRVDVEELDDGDLREALEVSAAWSTLTSHREFLVEPGPTLARALLPTADRLWVFRSPNKINAGPTAPRAATIPDHYVPTATLALDGDVLTEYLNTRSPAFFAATPSADIVLARDSVA